MCFFFSNIRDPEIAVNKSIMKYLDSFNRAVRLTAIHWNKRDDIVRTEEGSAQREERSNDFGSGRGHLLRSVPTLPLPAGRALRRLTAGILFQWDGTENRALTHEIPQIIQARKKPETRRRHRVSAASGDNIETRWLSRRTVLPTRDSCILESTVSM